MGLSPVLPTLATAGRYQGTRDTVWHSHDGMEVVHVVSGHRAYEVGGTTLEASPGDMVVLPDSVRHMQHTFEETVTRYATIRGFQGIFDDSPRTIHVGDDIVVRWLADLAASRQGSAALSAGCENALSLALLQRLAQLEQAGEPYHPAVRAALECMRERLADPKLSLGVLARQAGLSTSHLSLLFRQQLRASPIRVLERMRIDRARQLLESPYDTIKGIAGECGYRQTSYFCRVFRGHVGESPGQYRRRHARHYQSPR